MKTFIDTIPTIAKGLQRITTAELAIKWVENQLLYAYEFGHADAEEKHLKEQLAEMEAKLMKSDREIALLKTKHLSQMPRPDFEPMTDLDTYEGKLHFLTFGIVPSRLNDML